MASLSADVAVVGAGPAGIAAATCAGEAGANVLVLDEGAGPGGQIWRQKQGSLPSGARRWIDRFRRSGARLLSGTQVVHASGHRLVAEGSAGETVEVRARTIVIATGARERFLPFPGWTLPNVFGVGAAQALIKSGVRFRGKRVVVTGSGPLLLAAAASLASEGADVRVVAEQAPRAAIARFLSGLALRPSRLFAAARFRARFLGARYRVGTWVQAARGEGFVSEAVLTNGRRWWTERCDVLCCGYGLVPNLELPLLLGLAVVGERVVVDEFGHSSVPAILSAGEATGVGGVDLALVEGEIAGLAAAGRAREARRLFSKRARLAAFAASLAKAFALRPELKALPTADTIVCRCEDVALAWLNASWNRRQAKLYTRVGMGPCQGKVCGPALEFLFGWGADSVRVPLRPTALATFLSLAETEEGGTSTT